MAYKKRNTKRGSNRRRGANKRGRRQTPGRTMPDSSISNSVVARLNTLRISIKDADIYKLKYNRNINQTYGVDNVFAFMDSVRPTACLKALFKNNLQRYRYVKFNSFTYSVTIDAISWSLTGEVATNAGTAKYPVGAMFGFENTPFYLTWDLDNKYSKAPSDDRVCADPHGKTLLVSSQKPKVFHYNVPYPVRRYLDTSGILLESTDTDIGEYLSKVSAMSNFRAPNHWYGSLRQVFQNTDLTDLAAKNKDVRLISSKKAAFSCHAPLYFY